MAVDPAQIELTKVQKERLAALSERTGRSYSKLVDEWLSGIPVAVENGEAVQSTGRPKNLYEAFEAVGVTTTRI